MTHFYILAKLVPPRLASTAMGRSGPRPAFGRITTDRSDMAGNHHEQVMGREPREPEHLGTRAMRAAPAPAGGNRPGRAWPAGRRA